MDVSGMLDAVQSHAMRLGVFERVNTHEPKSSPGSGLGCAIWVQDMRPLPARSGLAASSARIAFNVRLYTPMLQEPQDAIDPDLLKTADVLMAAYSGDFDLGGTVAEVDLLGAYGDPLFAQAGYLTQQQTLYRVMTINFPVVVNDSWAQAA